MACFRIAQFPEGNVYADGWWCPARSQRVYLYLDAAGDLYVTRDADTAALGYAVAYTWPRMANNNRYAARLAWRHYERKTS